MIFWIWIVFGCFGCAEAGDEALSPAIKSPAVDAKDAKAVVEALNLRAENMKLQIQLLQAQRKQVEYEYSAQCYKDKRWRDFTGRIEDLTRQLEQYLIGASK